MKKHETLLNFLKMVSGVDMFASYFYSFIVSCFHKDVREFEGGNWEPIPINENAIFELEPPEKLLGRLSVYQKALLYMIEHFETMRPLLSEIKQAYTEVLDKCEKDWKELDKLRMEQLRRREAYAAHVRAKDKDGDRALMEVNLQIHALQEHRKPCHFSPKFNS